VHPQRTNTAVLHFAVEDAHCAVATAHMPSCAPLCTGRLTKFAKGAAVIAADALSHTLTVAGAPDATGPMH
jgi:hypothetical protein